MYPRINYELTDEDLKDLLDACKPTVCMKIGNYRPATPQEKANRAWAVLGKKMGFDHMTVRPIQGKDHKFFTAVPSETESQREERISREKEKKRQAEILKLQEEIVERKNRLIELLGISGSP